MQRLLLAIVVGSLATACASSGHARIEASALPACMNRPDLTGWHQVSGDGMTFCVPEGWASTGMRSWHGEEGSVRWGAGARGLRIEERVVTVAVPRGQAAPRPPASTSHIRIVYDTSELVGGVAVDLYVLEKDGSFETGASWNAGNPMHMTGTAPTSAAADVQMNIYRSIRFEARDRPE